MYTPVTCVLCGNEIKSEQHMLHTVVGVICYASLDSQCVRKAFEAEAIWRDTAMRCVRVLAAYIEAEHDPAKKMACEIELKRLIALSDTTSASPDREGV